MTIEMIELSMSQVSTLLMTPVLILIVLLMIYALFSAGRFIAQLIIRRKNKLTYIRQISSLEASSLQGYPIHNYYMNNPNASEDELEVVALKELETLRIVTRVAPMLGLIATMIPMGPALQALADGNIQGISENLIIAFAAVIWGLVISSITFWPASVKKRWCANELINIRKLKEA
ncbi:MotA/TolQ/ExbB proton channel family protein [Thalassotalea sp. LPB0316]|uniref:MotA/TolQ/ExbB proton channel family protein n=1 Tax=Thalassotalea sp. LPB0316 TaxID=2769490 RepID=UPI00186725BC|nr:MotA/TolQ/ExbB proton channel family protein [Thalassotalea sp. LPB0316]QOL25839.1 MotA/TolQ/ExbB proton channel family protein [Thalassotalea sp. LPB0316]